MSQKRLATAVGLALLGAAAISPVVAHAASPQRTRGSIAAVDPTTITVTTRSGAKLSYAINADTKIAGERTVSVSEIQPGSYIGSAAVPAGGGKLRALEVTVFPPAMKGVGEGHYAWDLAPHSSMTNGTVGHLTASNGNTMTVTYQGGEKTIIVPADVPIVTVDPGAVTDLKPGLKVIVFPAKGEPKTAGTIVYGENGITPPQ